jgi:hypothetical protein
MASSIAGVGSKHSSRLTSRRRIISRSSFDNFGSSAIMSCTLIFVFSRIVSLLRLRLSIPRAILEGEKRYWVHVALDRDFANNSVDALGTQLEEVAE